jgi:hypothetical protein
MLQKLSTARSQAAAKSTESQTGTSQASPFDEAFEKALSAAGLDESEVDQAMSEIKSAVSAALSESDGTTDPREAVSNAIDTTLQQYGVDTDKLKEELRASGKGARPSGPPPGPPPGAGGQGGFDTKITDALTAAGVDSSKLDEIKSAIDEAVAAARENSDGTTGEPGDIKATVHSVLDQYDIDTDAFDKEMESGMQAPSAAQTASTATSSQSTSLLDFLKSYDSSSSKYDWLSGLLQFVDEKA